MQKTLMTLVNLQIMMMQQQLMTLTQVLKQKMKLTRILLTEYLDSLTAHYNTDE